MRVRVREPLEAFGGTPFEVFGGTPFEAFGGTPFEVFDGTPFTFVTSNSHAAPGLARGRRDDTEISFAGKKAHLGVCISRAKDLRLYVSIPA
jgi:hypothetical protein